MRVYVLLDDNQRVIARINEPVITHDIKTEDENDRLYLPEHSPVELGWHYLGGGEFEPPSEDELLKEELQNELMEINMQLRAMFQDEQFNTWLGGVQPLSAQVEGANKTKKELLMRREEILEKLAELERR